MMIAITAVLAGQVLPVISFARKLAKSTVCRSNLQQLGAVTMVYAEANVAQWNTLITSSIDEMAEFGAAGIKKEDVLALLNSLTLLWIGLGVN